MIFIQFKIKTRLPRELGQNWKEKFYVLLFIGSHVHG